MKDIQNLINNNLNKLTFGLTRPQKKAVKETVNGIIRHKSCILQQIFAETKNNRVSKKVENVLNQLKQIDITTKTNDLLRDRLCKSIENETVIAFDEGEIAKPKAKKMENLTRIWDASKKRRCNGYNLCGLATKQSFLCLEIWNKNEESISEIRWRMIESVAKKTQGKGIFVFDRGHDHTALIRKMAEKGLQFIIRAKDLRRPFDNKLGIKRNITDFETGYHSIKVTQNKPSKNLWTGSLYLVVTEIKDKDEDGKLRRAWFLTNLSPEKYSIRDIQNFYTQRWCIESHYQQIKTHYGLESVRIHSIKAIKALLALCNFALWITSEAHLKISQTIKGLWTELSCCLGAFIRFCKRFSLKTSSVSAFRSFIANNLPVFFSKIVSKSSPPTLFPPYFLKNGVF